MRIFRLLSFFEVRESERWRKNWSSNGSIYVTRNRIIGIVWVWCCVKLLKVKRSKHRFHRNMDRSRFFFFLSRHCLRLSSFHLFGWIIQSDLCVWILVYIFSGSLWYGIHSTLIHISNGVNNESSSWYVFMLLFVQPSSPKNKEHRFD